MTSTIYFQAFGKLKLQVKGNWITHFPTRQVEELTGYLLLHQNKEHCREKLATILWPDHAPDKGRACLSTALWRLRCLFKQAGFPPENLIYTTRNTITLALTESAVLDTIHFESLISQGKTNPDDSCQLLQQAITLYQGDFCQGIYADWCLIERERLARQHLWALGRLMIHQTNAKQYRQALEIGHCLLSHDPLREDVHRALMYCHQKLGQDGQAIQQFQNCASLLQKELGIIPLPETVALYQQILTNRLHAVHSQQTHPKSCELDNAFADFLRASARLANLIEDKG